MIEFPGEDSFVQEIKENCGKQFDFARRCLQLGLKINKIPEKCEISHLVVKSIVGLNINNCRLYRTAIELCQRGEIVGASIILRVMFESVLAIKFILEPNIQSPFEKTDREFRAKLYGVQLGLARKRLFENLESDKSGLDKIGIQLDKSDLDFEQECKKIIGEEWFERIKKKPPFKKYGFNFEQLSEILGSQYSHWYYSIYSMQSEHVHAKDADDFFIYNGNNLIPIWFSDMDNIFGGLYLASGLFLHSLGTICENINFGDDVKTVLNTLERDFKEIYSH